ncbi:MAG: class I SAM-dependent methyltransferase [Deltaproteobacteria bacterium]|nr:class I SAM-dependent methyltransferase [Deltaproteobacteria bacterium]
MSAPWLPGVHSAPNIQSAPAIYEIENLALDRERLITDAMWSVMPWDEAVVCDLGAGAGFWASEFQAAAKHVFLVEPHGPSRLLAAMRVAKHRWENVSVMAGSASKSHLATGTVDFVQSRFAYFWGPGCEPGIKEVERILRPGGAFVMIDNDLRAGTFAEWLRKLPERYQRDPYEIDAFWRSQGFQLSTVRSSWRFDRRSDLEAVVKLELPSICDEVLAQHEGLEVDYGFRIISKRF